jgi:hypothetical protein
MDRTHTDLYKGTIMGILSSAYLLAHTWDTLFLVGRASISAMEARSGWRRR